ncbi:MAG TPA: serine--tRNA ligase [Thermoleophilia bacterium]|nr:serine--tRNA ligase [Thermoleophilia bacterium]
MLDVKLLRARPDEVREALRRRGGTSSLDEFLVVEERRRRLVTEVEQRRARRNEVTEQIAQAKREGGSADAQIAAMRALGDEIKTFERELGVVEQRLEEMLLEIPNIPLPDVPAGGEGDSVVLRHEGEPRRFDFEPRDHLDLGTALGVIDMERAAKVSGSRFAYLLGDLPRLEFALVRYALDIVEEKGFVPVIPPVLVREEAMYGTGFLPTDRAQIYETTDGDFLVGTSEVPLAGLHMDELLDAESLPLRYTGFSSCFRREAGAAGKDTRGIFRVHQFDKLEMFVFCLPEESPAEQELILATEEEILVGLDIPYRVVNIAAGDLGAPAAKKYDLEAWFPGQERYREVTSCSNCTDYQARRLKCRFRTDKGPRFAHTLNGTAVAIGRTIAAIMENHQRADGTVEVPSALRAHMGKDVIGPAR